MSSLAASRADNFYHPPEWDPSKESRKKFQNNKGKNQYETDGIIRFELPMDAWCSGCERHYGKGTRWNAKKEADGKYFSTKIFKFTMTCHSCPMKIIIATDPKNSDYEFREGLVKKEEEADDLKDLDEVNQQVQESVDSIYKVGGHAAEKDREYKRTNMMYKLEHNEDDKKRAMSESERFDDMLEQGVVRRRYDYDANASMRVGMREKRKAAEFLEREREALQLSIPLSQLSSSDQEQAVEAFKIAAASKKTSFREISKDKYLAAMTGSAFGEMSQTHQNQVHMSKLAKSIPAVKELRERVKTNNQASQVQEAGVGVVDICSSVGEGKKNVLTKNGVPRRYEDNIGLSQTVGASQITRVKKVKKQPNKCLKAQPDSSFVVMKMSQGNEVGKYDNEANKCFDGEEVVGMGTSGSLGMLVCYESEEEES